MKTFRIFFLLIISAGFVSTCRVDDVKKVYKTKHVIVIVMDGARYSETFGDSSRHLIPFLNQTLLPQGVMITTFRNNGNTWTSAGHDAMCTGIYEPLDNGGNQLPSEPSMFQYWRKATGAPAEKAWIITSKDKLFVLANTTNADYQAKYMASFDCGNSGPLSGYRDDSTTTVHILDKLNQYHPDLVLVNFREPDYSGHQGNWTNYQLGIYNDDHYISEIWSFLQNDPYYAGTTTLIVTNDHGRHLDGHLDGFVSHGDDCEGCRHISFVAAGPDFKRNFVSDINYDQIDIPRTISELLDFPMPTGGGQVMTGIMR